MARGKSRAKRFLEKLEAALTASALAEEGESDAARAIEKERSGPAAPARGGRLPSGSASAAAAPRAGR